MPSFVAEFMKGNFAQLRSFFDIPIAEIRDAVNAPPAYNLKRTLNELYATNGQLAKLGLAFFSHLMTCVLLT